MAGVGAESSKEQVRACVRACWSQGVWAWVLHLLHLLPTPLTIPRPPLPSSPVPQVPGVSGRHRCARQGWVGAMGSRGSSRGKQRACMPCLSAPLPRHHTTCPAPPPAQCWFRCTRSRRSPRPP